MRRDIDRYLKPFDCVERPWIIDGDGRYIDFSSNDYLGLRFDEKIQQAYIKGIKNYGNGSGGSPLVSGYDFLKQQFEEQFSSFVNFEQSLLVGSGYCANLCVFSTLFCETDTAFFLDKSCHASIYDAFKLHNNNSLQLYRFPHQDLNYLEKKLSTCKSLNKVIVSEGIFSMTGSQLDITELVFLKNKYNASLVIDDSHCVGVKGAKGRGTSSYVKQGDIDVLTSSFGKAFAMQGGIISASKNNIQKLIKGARPYIYSTALGSAMIAGLFEALSVIERSDQTRLQLEKNIRYFNHLKQMIEGDFLNSTSAIQFLRCKDLVARQQLSKQLILHGLYCYLIREPTVAPKNTGFRIVLSAAHATDQIKNLFSVIEEFN